MEDKIIKSIFIEEDDHQNIIGYKVFSTGLLSLRIEERDSLIEQVKNVARKSSDIQKEATTLILHDDWRAQIIGITLGLTHNLHLEKILRCVWDRIRLGSWILPQLLAFAKLLDSNFQESAEDLLREYRATNPPSDEADFSEIKKYSRAKNNVALVEYALRNNQSLDINKKEIFDAWLLNASEIITMTNLRK